LFPAFNNRKRIAFNNHLGKIFPVVFAAITHAFNAYIDTPIKNPYNDKITFITKFDDVLIFNLGAEEKRINFEKEFEKLNES
jgi:hypothetical protein